MDALRREVQGELRTDWMSRVLYSTDASIYQVMPLGVLFPATPDDVEAAVVLAARYKVPILPRTAGTSLAGQAVNEALVIDLSRHLNRVLEINAEERWVRVEPGVVLDALNRELAPTGFMFGPDPASGNRAALGGMVGNNATGSHSILYGMTADHVLETAVLLSDGSRVRFGPVDGDGIDRFLEKPGREGEVCRAIHSMARDHRDTILAGTPRHWRRAGGYNLDRFVEGASFRWPRDPRFNLARLICGSEGTLAVMTEIKLGLVERPAGTALAVVHFDRLEAALDAVPAVLEVGPSAVEFMDQVGLALTREVPAFNRLLRSFLDGEPECILITEFHGESETELEGKIRRLEAHLGASGVAARVTPVLEAAKKASVWSVRKAGLGLMMSMKGDAKPIPFIEDAAVPVEHLTDYVTRIEAFCRDLGTRVAYYAHASAGCLHIRPIINLKDASDVAKLPEITRCAIDLLGEYGGCLSSEHGDGRSRSGFNEAFFGTPLYSLYRRVKAAFDPENLFNPGNIVDAPFITDHLRHDANRSPPPIDTATDFTDEGGLLRAVELCNGAGACLKGTDGVMCPSFMVTHDEEHSTRGRANALRAVLSGRVAVDALGGPRLREVMDLCIGCKACKAECPSAVDLARLKVEYLAHYYRRNPVPLRARFFAGIGRTSRFLSGWPAPLVNALLRPPPVRWALEKWLGVSRRRRLPRFASRPFPPAWSRRRGAPRAKTGGPSVLLFCDSFNAFGETENALAAAEVLEAAGLTVQVTDHGCCGRPMLSQGLVNRARQAAKRVVDSLTPFVEQGVPVVGLEPSCLLTLRDEYAHLLPGDPRVDRLAEHAFLFEEFLDRLREEGRLDLRFTDRPRSILIHGHCHEKALVGTGPLRRVLSLPPGYEVTEIDGGCCGMAGAFGYEVEHQAISMQMAELRLLPAIRAASADTLIVAPGVSCRQQILDGTGRGALHPAKVLREALEG
jgi:FAD/FMN-containing dehydrogenase/Fe-S oxidoreductase